MDASYQSYLDLLGELSGSLERLAQLAQDKAAVVRQDDLIGLDGVLKQEQAMALNLRGLEQRRLKLAAQLGLSGVPLADLPGRCPSELEVQAGRMVEQPATFWRSTSTRLKRPSPPPGWTPPSPARATSPPVWSRPKI